MSGRGRRGRYPQGGVANRPGNFPRYSNQAAGGGGTWKQLGPGQTNENQQGNNANDAVQSNTFVEEQLVKEEQPSFQENVQDNTVNENVQGDVYDQNNDADGDVAMDDQENGQDQEQNGDISEYTTANGKLHFAKIFKSRKKPSVRAKEKKLRVNRHLRKAIFPKNALMAMNELKGLTISEFSFTNNETGGFTAVVSVNGKQHEGKGSSKIVAKNNACESALRDFVIAKMIQKPRQTKRNKTSSISSVNEQDMESMDDTQSVAESQKSSGTMDEGDDLPMVNLASFALFKLFSEWEREGYVVPEMHPHDYESSSTTNLAEANDAKPATKRSELPKDWEHMHPATLLCMMRPGISYKDLGSVGEKNNILHRLGVTVDEKEFVESGRSKKLARKNVAIAACNDLFGTNFERDDS